MILQPMKPAKIDLDKESHRRKLDDYFESPEYIAEEKIDGCHYFNHAGRFLSTKVSKRTNELVDKTDNFPHLVEDFFKANLGQTILDGEIYYPGTDSFYATQVTGCLGETAVQRQEQDLGWIKYIVFDILRDAKGNWLFNLPWYKRREILEQVGVQLTKNSEHYHIIPVRRSRKKQFMENLLSEGKEGIVLKHTLGIYIPGKRPMNNWMKVKTGLVDDVILMGYEPPKRAYSGKDYDSWPYWENGEPVSKHYYHKQIGSIRFGKYDHQDNLVELGSCTGIDDRMRQEFTSNGDKYVGEVIIIKAMERTEDGRYRHPNFVQVHPDKNPYECRLGGEGR